MTASTKTNSSTAASRDRQDDVARPDRGADAARPDAGADAAARNAAARLDELVRAHGELTHEIRQLVARQAVDRAADGDDGERAGPMVTVARADLLALREQEQARHQLDRATRSGADAVDGVVRSVTTVVRALIPASLVRPEDLVEAAWTVADHGLRVGRRLALGVSSSVRDLTPSA
ncbi:hypothetical protein OF117_07815 [Geodermatophilus sp. YIM 151500]|uniref:hypothetical protein n=1 Tax=Geodermatophilus sp. YIM 151500 TaxID=2984531 RepID=UPI0021E3A702|nr:hypothetical protein [Geodermatophilus sp. YIM 151500]MCV2489269.1 hypothetical protein [Geodermatophilus sp. YIM 151500]